MVIIKNKFILMSVVGISCVLGGCAPVTSSTGQSLYVTPVSKDNTALTQVSCRLFNDKGDWKIVAPENIMIQKSSKDLRIVCDKSGFEQGKVTAVSKAGSGMGEALF